MGGDICTPMADSCWRQKTNQSCKATILQLKINRLKKKSQRWVLKLGGADTPAFPVTLASKSFPNEGGLRGCWCGKRPGWGPPLKPHLPGSPSSSQQPGSQEEFCRERAFSPNKELCLTYLLTKISWKFKDLFKLLSNQMYNTFSRGSCHKKA